MKLFGTNGIRGKVGEDFNPEFLVKVGMAIGTFLPERAVVIIGRDTRISGDAVKGAVLSGLLATGVNVVDIGMVSTPAVQLYTKNHGNFGIVITASHNPAEFNGVKVVDGDGTELLRENEIKIENIFYGGNFRIVPWDRIGKYKQASGAREEYINRILSLVDVKSIQKKKFKVVLDCANGASCFTSPYLIERLGAKVTTLNCQPDGTFPGHPSEPKPENLHDLVDFVRSGEFDIGVAHDGDADRVIFVDEKGNFIYGDKILALLAGMLGGENDVIVTPVSSSLAVEETVRRKGARIVYTKVGAPIVARKMLELGARFGGEENGGLIFPEMQYCRDGGMGLAKLLEIMAISGKKLSELIAEIPEYFQRKVTVSCPENLKIKVLEELKSQLKEGTITAIDGIKISGENWWVLIRPSGTEPIFRIYAEAKDKEQLEKLSEKYSGMVERLIKNNSMK